MNEENILQTEEVQKNILQTENIEENLLKVDNSINNLLQFFQTEKEESIKKEQEDLKKLNQEKKIQEEEQLKIEEEHQKKEEEFLTNIQTIAENTNTEVNTQLLQEVSTLMQVNIITFGLLIGIVCVSLFAKFFKR